MILTVLSDIHADINKKRKSKNFTKELIDYLNSLETDILLITGDIAAKLGDIGDFFLESTDLDVTKKLFVPGNHDIWVNKSSFDLSLTKYYKILPELADKFGWYYLPLNPVIIDNTAFVGSIGWYDYSLRNPIWDSDHGLSIYENKINPINGLSWMDKYFVKLGKMSDKSITQKFINDMKMDIKKISIKTKYNSLVLATHMVPFREFIHYRGLFDYDYFTAFFGSQSIGDYYYSLPDEIQKFAIFGQTHIPKIKKMKSNLTGYCVPIGYPREYGKNRPLDTVFAERIQQIKLN